MKEEYRRKRESLKQLSATIRMGMRMGALEDTTINEALLDMYRKEGHKEFKTFNQWLWEGKMVKKGEHAYLVWGKPRKVSQAAPDEKDDEYKYWPLCYLFGDGQVEDMKREVTTKNEST